MDLRIKNDVALIVLIAIVCSCSTSSETCVSLSGIKLNVQEDISISNLLYADDSIILAKNVSPVYSLTVIPCDGSKPEEFLRKGNGPMEVSLPIMCCVGDTLELLDYNGSSIQEHISIPLSNLNSESWKTIKFDGISGKMIGSSMCRLQDGRYLIVGSDFRDESVLSVLDMSDSSCVPFDFWPEDGFDGNSIAKQSMYIRNSKVYSSGKKCLYVCGEGQYAVIIDLTHTSCIEIDIFDEKPIYTVKKDGINPKRGGDCKIGFRSFATKDRIYLGRIQATLQNGIFRPGNLRGYPPEYVDKVDVFDWSGRYICSFQFDVPFADFFVSSDDRTLYMRSDNLETHYSEIYKYDLAW